MCKNRGINFLFKIASSYHFSICCSNNTLSFADFTPPLLDERSNYVKIAIVTVGAATFVLILTIYFMRRLGWLRGKAPIDEGKQIKIIRVIAIADRLKF